AILIEMIRGAGGYEVVEVTDPRPELWGTEILGVPIRGGDDRLPVLHDAGVAAAFVGVGSVKSVAVRKRLFEQAVSLGFELITVIHPRAVVAPSAQIGRGTMVLPAAVIHTRATIGDNVTIYSGVLVEHDTEVGHHAHLSPGVHVAGGVRIGAECFIGIGASIIQNVRIGVRAVVGAGAVVLHDIPEGCTALGVPARLLRRAERNTALVEERAD
ncbi:MAG: acetyltransferase, partial [Chloroflexi bacterium]|nr:acetyltransferase [Chloroflexota bacterium]